MESGKVKRLNVQVLLPVDTLTVGVWVTAVTWKAETLISKCDQVVGVQGLDVLRDLGGPVVDDSRVAAVAARLVGQLPGQDGIGVGVSAHNSLDVLFVLRLRIRIGEPCFVGSTKRSGISRDTAIVVPVVDKIDL